MPAYDVVEALGEDHVDGFAQAAIALNAEANKVVLGVTQENLFLDGARDDGWDVILAGDIFYERDTADAALAFVSRHAMRGARILIGDPGRTYLPKDRLTKRAEYRVPVTRELEDSEIKNTAVWTLG